MSGLMMNTASLKFFGRHIVGHAIELSGLIFMSVALIINMIAAISIAGFSTLVSTYIALSVACFLRGRALLVAQKVGVPVEVPVAGARDANR